MLGRVTNILNHVNTSARASQGLLIPSIREILDAGSPGYREYVPFEGPAWTEIPAGRRVRHANGATSIAANRL